MQSHLEFSKKYLNLVSLVYSVLIKGLNEFYKIKLQYSLENVSGFSAFSSNSQHTLFERYETVTGFGHFT